MAYCLAKSVAESDSVMESGHPAAFSSVPMICPNRGRHRAWTVDVNRVNSVAETLPRHW